MNILDKLHLIRPEIALFASACIVMLVGLSRSYANRTACAWIAAVGLVVAGYLAFTTPIDRLAPHAGLMPELIPYAKTVIAALALPLLLLLTGTADRDYERRVARGERFDPIRATRGEFYAFFLFSVMGVMLCASADDLIWLFLALELTSLPTYIMVAMSSSRLRSQEAAVKYFFLGAFGAAMFLYGFALLYGATGTTMLPQIAQTFAHSGMGTLGTLGMLFALIGVSFKIAAVPMHFYTPDVYEGASSPVAAYLAFAPKAAGILSILLLLSTLGWGPGGGAGTAGLPEPIRVALWVIAALTMTVGNVMAILQSSVKRILAYSSIAHSGYMLVGLIAGPGDGALWRNGLAATLFYLLCYGAMNLGAFAVLACVERRARAGGEHAELETVDDLRGLCQTQPALGWTMVLCVMSLLGFPPLLGFFAKLFLFTAAISSGELVLAVILGLNSAIAAFYYLRLASAVYFESHDERQPAGHVTPFGGRVLAGVLSAVSTVALLPFISPLQAAGRRAVGLAEVSGPRAPTPKAAPALTSADSPRPDAADVSTR